MICRHISYHIYNYIPYIYKKEGGPFRPAFSHSSALFNCDSVRLEIRDSNCTVVKAAILDEFLPVASHDALRWDVAVGVHDRWGSEHWDIGSIEVTRIHDAVTLEAQEDLAVGEDRVLVELQLALDCTGLGDADFHAFFS